jgi:hypothetical protein
MPSIQDLLRQSRIQREVGLWGLLQTLENGHHGEELEGRDVGMLSSKVVYVELLSSKCMLTAFE